MGFKIKSCSSDRWISVQEQPEKRSIVIGIEDGISIFLDIESCRYLRKELLKLIKRLEK